MKKRILIIISVLVIVCSFVACTNSGSSEAISTTAVTDVNGNTHYYEPVTDENKEIVTKENGDVVITKITPTSKSTKTQTTSTSAKNKADNVIDYEPVTNTTTTATAKPKTTVTKTTQTNTTTQKSTTTTNPTTNKQIATTNPTTQKPIQPITDKDGWINKWY